MRGIRRPKSKKLWIILAILIILAAGGALASRAWYNRNLAAVSSAQTYVTFTVESGASLHQIATGLKDEGLIRSAPAFETYVHGRSLYSKMQAGTYSLSPSMSTPQIVSKIVKGDVTKSDITIYPGKTIDDIRKIFKQVGYSDAELDTAFNAAAYTDEPIMNYLPAGASLEGFLYPDTFQRTGGTPAQTIVRESLQEMNANLTPDIIAGFKAQGLNVFQGVILASIVNQESGDPNAQPTIAQVFLLRLKQGMLLQSNVTANYAADLAGVARNVAINSPYNTYLHQGLPPGPIGNVTASALKAVAHPSNTTYLFFIAGDNGAIHFSSTEAEHEQAIKQYCHNLCAQ
jgi:UPF0755 protein